MSPQRITQKEYQQYIEQQMVANGFSRKERNTVRAAFDASLHHEDWQEYAERVGSFFGQAQRPGITESELEETMSELRDPHSPLSQSVKVPVRKDKIDKLEEIMHEALEENKERLF